MLGRSLSRKRFGESLLTLNPRLSTLNVISPFGFDLDPAVWADVELHLAVDD